MKINNLLILLVTVLLIGSLGSCASFQQLQQLPEMQQQMDEFARQQEEINNRQETVEQTYSDVQDFIEVVSAEADFKDPRAFARNLIEARIKIEEGADKLGDILDKGTEELHSERDLVLRELEAFLRGYEERVTEVNVELEELISSANNRFQLSVRGLQEKVASHKRDIDSQIRNTIRGLEVQMQEQETGMTESLESLRRELRVLIVGRDSILDRIETKVSVLANSFEDISDELKDH